VSSNPVQSLLRVPPFPGSRPASFVRPTDVDLEVDDDQIDWALREIASRRVGGTYWAARPPLPEGPYTLVRVRDLGNTLAQVAEQPRLLWLNSPGHSEGRNHAAATVAGPCDPWHLLARAESAITDADDELAMIAALAGLPVQCLGQGPFQALTSERPRDDVLRHLFRQLYVRPHAFVDPFTGEQSDLGQVVEISSFWRGLVDSNRDIEAAFGFAFWKRSTVAPLLWGGTGRVPFESRARVVPEGVPVAVWSSRVASPTLAELRGRRAQMLEVEDGFIRSTGLGADCVPPLSIVVDRLGVHFDPTRSSDLEHLLEEATFSQTILERARRLRELIVSLGLSKYCASDAAAGRRVAGRRHILVPGQVEDDRSVQCGGGKVKTNLELLRRAREEAPDAYILYKPHPDVEAGHRVGAIPDETCLSFADEIVRGEAISPLIAMVDEIHVNTSLAGFEALLRGKVVTTHGVPFYAGWGLTNDLGAVPSRRSRQRSLDELVAAVLLIYPRYLDPETRLPCPPEILIRRLSQPLSLPKTGPVVLLRRLQGRLKQRLTTIRPW